MSKEIKKEEQKNEKVEKVEKKENKSVKTISHEEKKKKMIQICAIALGLIIVLGVILFLTRGSRLSQEEKLNRSLTKMGEEFYTEFYYTEISKNKSDKEVSEFLSKFQDIGIKVNLDNLSRYNDGANEDEIANFKNEKGTACNTTNTRAVIYPKSPYGKKDYTVKVELDCGFDSNSNTK